MADFHPSLHRKQDFPVRKLYMGGILGKVTTEKGDIGPGFLPSQKIKNFTTTMMQVMDCPVGSPVCKASQFSKHLKHLCLNSIWTSVLKMNLGVRYCIRSLIDLRSVGKRKDLYCLQYEHAAFLEDSPGPHWKSAHPGTSHCLPQPCIRYSHSVLKLLGCLVLFKWTEKMWL